MDELSCSDFLHKRRSLLHLIIAEGLSMEVNYGTWSNYPGFVTIMTFKNSFNLTLHKDVKNFFGHVS